MEEGAALVSVTAGVTGRSHNQAEWGEGEDLSNKQSWLKNGQPFPSLPTHLRSEFFVHGGIQEKFGRSLFSKFMRGEFMPWREVGVG